MTSAEVFEVVGSDYDKSFDTYKLEERLEYDYFFEAGEVFDTELDGYMFFEFRTETDELVTFGCHFGQSGDIDDPVYPHSEEELKTAYDSIKTVLTKRYGEGTSKEPDDKYGVRGEHSWQLENDQVWAVYGVNLWGWGEPSAYEYGINAVTVSCTSVF